MGSPEGRANFSLPWSWGFRGQLEGSPERRAVAAGTCIDGVAKGESQLLPFSGRGRCRGYESSPDWAHCIGHNGAWPEGHKRRRGSSVAPVSGTGATPATPTLRAGRGAWGGSAKGMMPGRGDIAP